MLPPPAPPLRELLDRHAGVLLDAYGVLVDLDGALPGAAALIRHLNHSDKPYLLVSNTAARLPEHAAERYRGFGLELEAARILTSGMLLAEHFRAHALAGRRCLVLGPEDSAAYVARAGGHPVGLQDDFDVLVLADQAGFPFVSTLDRVISHLFARLDAGIDVPLVLPNPDLLYPTAHGYGFTAGSVALMLEAALARRYPGHDGVRFARLGKPHPGLFEAAARRLGSRDLIMIGDQLETDIRGARDFGIAAALVLGGVSGPASADHRGLPGALRPDYLLPNLLDL